jgi:hypothetical protein
MDLKKLAVVFIVLALGAGAVYFLRPQSKAVVTSFDQCVTAGNPVMESYPPRCTAPGQTFVQDIGNELEKSDLIKLDSPRPNQVVTSPLEISGTARGTWFFEASFPVYLYDSAGNQLAGGVATAQSEWTTDDFVPFTTTLSFTAPKEGVGELVLQKDNPSGLPEYDDALRVPVKF